MEYSVLSDQSVFDVSLLTVGIENTIEIIKENDLEWDDELTPLFVLSYPDTVFTQVIVPEKPKETISDNYLAVTYFGQTYYDVMAMNEGSFDGIVDWMSRNNLEFDQTPITGDVLTCKISKIENNSIHNVIKSRKLVFITEGEAESGGGHSFDLSFDLSFDS